MEFPTSSEYDLHFIQYFLLCFSRCGSPPMTFCTPGVCVTETATGTWSRIYTCSWTKLKTLPPSSGGSWPAPSSQWTVLISFEPPRTQTPKLDASVPYRWSPRTWENQRGFVTQHQGVNAVFDVTRLSRSNFIRTQSGYLHYMFRFHLMSIEYMKKCHFSFQTEENEM